MMTRKSRQMGKGLQWLWGKESLKVRLLRAAVGSPFALLAVILQWVGNSTHNDLLWWSGVVIMALLWPLTVITLALIMAVRRRQQAREQEQ